MDSGDDFMCAVMRAALLYAKMNFVLLGEHKNTVDACTAAAGSSVLRKS